MWSLTRGWRAGLARTASSQAALFFRPEVQAELMALTGLDFERVFRKAKTGQEIQAPAYKFVTDVELASMYTSARERARARLQMPPVMDVRQPVERVLESDPALSGYSAAPIVFTDITYGVHDRDRLVVVREVDGTLREAYGDERDRVNQIYFPREGRKLEPPLMFEPEALADILQPEKYAQILDRNCLQFEPDHPSFVRTAETVYDHADRHGQYSRLYSTRHYGPMVFFLIRQQRCDDLLVHYLQSGRSEAVHAVLRLYRHIHPDSATARSEHQRAEAEPAEGFEWLRDFIREDARKGPKLHAALESMLEAQKTTLEAQTTLV